MIEKLSLKGGKNLRQKRIGQETEQKDYPLNTIDSQYYEDLPEAD